MLKKHFLSEILWITVAAIVALVVVGAPVFGVGFYYNWISNALIVFGFIFVVRLLFFSSYAPWLRPLAMKGVTILLAIPCILFTILTINEVQTFVDAEGYAALFYSPNEDAIDWAKYVRNEVVFFGSAFIVALILLPVILLIKAWKQVKAKEKVIY